MSEIINMSDEFYEVSKNEPIDYAQIVQERIDRYNAKNKPFEKGDTYFSPLINIIPLNKNTDGNREQMSKAHHSQSLTLVGDKEVPNFKTRYLDSIARNSPYFVKKARADGTIIKSNHKLVIEYFIDGVSTVDIVDVTPTDIVVKTGEIKKGEVYMRNNSMTQRGLSHGVHLNWVAERLPISHFADFAKLKLEEVGVPDTYEDSIILTNSGASKLTSEHNESLDYLVTKGIFDINVEVLRSGKIKKGDWIIREYNNLKQVLSAPIKTHAAEETAEIVGIELQVFDETLKFSEEVQEFINEYSVEKEYERLCVELPNVASKIKTSFKSLFSQVEDERFILRLHYYRESPIKVGDKLVNRFGNKGIVSGIVDDEIAKEYIMREYGIDFQPELIYSPFGIHTRMNPSQLGETVINYLCKVTVPNICKKMIDDKKDSMEILRYIIDNVHSVLDPKLGKLLTDSVIEPKKFKILGDILKNGLILEVDEDIDNGLINIAKICETLDPEYYENLEHLGYGISYTMKLSHQVEHKLKAVSTGEYSVKFNNPLEGQRIGEMELWAICAYEANAMLFSSQKTKSDEINSKSETFNEIVKHGRANIHKSIDKPSTALKLINSIMQVYDIDLNGNEYKGESK